MPEPGTGWGWLSLGLNQGSFIPGKCWILEQVRGGKGNSRQSFLRSPSAPIPGNSFLSLPQLGFELPALFPGVDSPFPWILLPMEGSGGSCARSRLCPGGNSAPLGCFGGRIWGRNWCLDRAGIWAGNPSPPAGKSWPRGEGWGKNFSMGFIQIIPGYQSSQSTQRDNLDP